MADINKWDSEYKELLLEHLHRLDKDVLINALIEFMRNSDVEAMIDIIKLVEKAKA